MKRNKLIYNFNNIIGSKPKRSTFYRSNMNKTTLNTGDIVPVYWDEVLPGDTFKMETKAVIRQTTMIKPIMDATYLEIMYFFVPWRIIWDNTKKFFGENTDPWAVTTEPTIPQVTAPAGGWGTGTIADYMGLPLGKTPLTVSALPFRAYAKIFNDWFRDENLQTATHINTTDATTTGSNGTNYITDLEKGGIPAKANKYHDYFTSCLPAPQKGEAIKISVGGTAEVHTKNTTFNVINDAGIHFSNYPTTGAQPLNINNTGYMEASDGAISGTIVGAPIPDNFYVDLNQTTGITINDLRQAIAYQQMLEKDARSGTRYVEFLKSHFGVDSPDARQQRSEYLGGLKQPMGVNQIPQTNSTDATTPQANLAAYGESKLQHNSFKKTFTEHGYAIGIAIVRYNHTYQQGLERAWTRKDRNDLYDPIFANLGEQPVLNKEIYCQGTATDEEIFGFQEAWADYRYKPSRVTGKMRSGTDSLDIWHFADNYASLPTLSEEWIKEDQKNVDRTLAIKSTGDNAEPQFQCDFYFNNKCERAMPTYSIPGLKRI